jgi:nitrate reductase NapE component
MRAPGPFRSRRLLVLILAVSTLVGAACAKVNTAGNLIVAAATTHLMVDDPDASIVDRRALTQDVNTLQARAELYGRLMTTTPVIDAIAKRARLPADQISGVARTTANVPIPLMEPGSMERAAQIRATHAPYRLELQSDPSEPILSIYAEAPTVDEALRLANASITGLGDYLRGIAQRQGFPQNELPQLRQLGSARGGVTNRKAKYVIGGLTFLTTFALTFVALFTLARRRRRQIGLDEPRPARPPRLTGRAALDWPRTTRVLPWSIAVLIATIWLTPFDKVQLAFSGPVDMSLDRLVLPLVAAVWLIAFSAGAAAPRLRLTPVHLALGAFLACALLSVVLDARYLNQTGELMLTFKKLPLLITYMSVFVMVASSIRRSEVQAFMTFTLILSVIVAVGIVIEYHFKWNIFTSLTRSFLPPGFRYVAQGSGDGLDALGRRWIAGPAQTGVEAVGMLAMALPIGFIGIIGARTRRRRLLYGVAIALLFAGMVATERKSALVVPVAVVGTLAYYRRRELLSLAPLGLVIGVMAVVASPSAVHGVISQFTRPDASNVATTSDRTSDYDAVRPDVWSHLLFGRGFGSYNHETYRILDSEVLGRVVETGALGLLAYLGIFLSLILIARRTVSARELAAAPLALCGIAAAVCFLVISTLYDAFSFPHGPYTFLYLAGLVVAVLAPTDEHEPHSRHAHVRVLRQRRLAPRRGAHPVHEQTLPIS